MKKQNLIYWSLFLSCSLVLFTLASWKVSDERSKNKSQCHVVEQPKGNPDFAYAIGPRFGGITKEKISTTRSIAEIFSDEHAESILEYYEVSVTLLDDSKETSIKAVGKGPEFTETQLQLLKNMDYSTNVLFRAEYLEKNRRTGKIEDSYSTPHLTIVPEKSAIYLEGRPALVDYLKSNSFEGTANTKTDDLEPGKLYFTIDKNGEVKNPELKVSCGYETLDNMMIGLISRIPGEWEAAENANGEKVEQKFVFHFGIVGC